MPRFVRLAFSLWLVLALCPPGTVAAQPAAQQPTQPRLVVFESFLASTNPFCVAAAPAINQLIQEFSSQPVAFVEYDSFRAPGFRADRFQEAWDAAHQNNPPYPRVMVDSGYRVSASETDLATYLYTYRTMVQDALARPAAADLAAVTRQVGDTVEFRVRVTNRSPVTLTGAANSATIHAVVIEGTKVRLTTSFGREAGFWSIDPPLAPGATITHTVTAYKLSTTTNGYNWDKMRGLVMLDYRPAGGTSGPYEMPQAAYAPGPLAPSPAAAAFLVDPAGPDPSPISVALQGATYQSWTATTDVPWLQVTPGGTPAQVPSVSVVRSALSAGWQEGSVYFAALDSQGRPWSAWVPVRAYQGALNRYHLPMAARG